MNNNLGSSINGLVQEVAEQPKQRKHNELYLDALNQKYGKPFDPIALDEADIIWFNNQGDDDWYNRNMDFLTKEYTKRVAKPDFDPIKFGKIIENNINSRLTYPNAFSQEFSKNTLSPTDRRYLASRVYDAVMDNYDFQQRELANKK